MSFLDNILGAVTQPVQDLGTGISAIGQSMRPDRGPQRRPRPTYTPEQERQIAVLSDFAARGASPDLVMSLFGEIEGDLQQRMEAYRAKNAMRREAMANLPAMAGQAFEMSQAGMPSSAIGAAFGGIPGRAGNILENQIIPTLGGGEQGLDQASVEGIAAKVRELYAAKVPLSRARQQIIGQMRMENSTPGEIGEAQDFIGQQYQSLVMPEERPTLIDAPISPAYAESLNLSGSATLAPLASMGAAGAPSPTAEAARARHEELMRQISSGYGPR